MLVPHAPAVLLATGTKNAASELRVLPAPGRLFCYTEWRRKRPARICIDMTRLCEIIVLQEWPFNTPNYKISSGKIYSQRRINSHSFPFLKYKRETVLQQIVGNIIYIRSIFIEYCPLNKRNHTQQDISSQSPFK